MKKKLIVSLVVVTILLCIFGCTKKTEEISIEKNEDKKVEVTMYLWDKNMTKDLTPWLEELFPQYNKVCISTVDLETPPAMRRMQFYPLNRCTFG